MRGLTLLFVLGAVLAAPSPARAGDDLRDLLTALRRTKDPSERRSLVRTLSTRPSSVAAGRIAELARSDPDPTVREAAAVGLGRSPAENATDLLLDLVPRGGIRSVRREAAKSLARRDGGLDRLVKLMNGAGKDPLGRGLAIRALSAFPDPDALVLLERMARGDDVALRNESLRTLAAHRQGREMLPAILVDVLREHHDFETVMTCLDLAQDAAEGDFRPVAALLGTFLQPEVQGAVEAAEARLDYLDALAQFRRASRDGYGTAEPPTPPPPRPRFDIVYVFDSTGSVTGHKQAIADKVLEEAMLLSRLGCDVRLGLVAYRDKSTRRSSFSTRSMPLTYDLVGVRKWIDEMRTRGADSQGATIYGGLRESLDRMGWRWEARRESAIVADSRAGDPGRCNAKASIHYRADRTRVHVWYVLRTRTKIPQSIRDLASIGGGVVEVLVE